MTRLRSGIVTVALLAAMLPALAGAAHRMPPPESHLAGCHGHGVPTSAPQPISYQCCVAGHHPVVVTNCFSMRPPQGILEAATAESPARPAVTMAGFSIAMVSAYSPPLSSPLRI
ncbi:MAG: hypothetical protein WCA16_13330 [Candidatus Sulfotelmatobacter sp.]